MKTIFKISVNLSSSKGTSPPNEFYPRHFIIWSAVTFPPPMLLLFLLYKHEAKLLKYCLRSEIEKLIVEY